MEVRGILGELERVQEQWDRELPIRMDDNPDIHVHSLDIDGYYPNVNRGAILDSIRDVVALAKSQYPEANYVTTTRNELVVQPTVLAGNGGPGSRWRPRTTRRVRERSFTVRWTNKRTRAQSMHLDDIVYVSELDHKWAVVRHCGRYWVQTSGLVQGSPSAPGQADLHGASLERIALEGTQRNPGEYAAMARRWMDDLLLIFRGNKPEWMTRIGTEFFYGNACKLGWGKAAQFAGLRFYTSGSEVYVVPLTPNEESLANQGILKVRRFAGGRSFGSAKKRRGTIVGHILYVIDRVVGPYWLLWSQLGFIIKELLLNEYSDSDVAAAVCMVQLRAPGVDIKHVWKHKDFYFVLGCMWRQVALVQSMQWERDRSGD